MLGHAHDASEIPKAAGIINIRESPAAVVKNDIMIAAASEEPLEIFSQTAGLSCIRSAIDVQDIAFQYQDRFDPAKNLKFPMPFGNKALFH